MVLYQKMRVSGLHETDDCFRDYLTHFFFISLFVAKNTSGVSLCNFGAPKSLSMQAQGHCPSPLEDASKEAPKLSG